MSRIVIIQYSSNRDGSAFSALMLASGLKMAGWETHVFFAFDGPMVQRFKNEGHSVRVVPHKSWLRTSHPLRFLKVFYHEYRASSTLSKHLQEVAPSIVYVNTAVSFAGALAARLRSIPVVWHIRELFSNVGGEMNAPTLYKPFMQRLFGVLSNYLVVNSDAVAENMLGALAGQAAVVPNAVDAAFFNDSTPMHEARKRFGLPERGVIVGVPGTLRPMKGHPFFFEALRRVLTQNPHVVAAVTGGGQNAYVKQLEEMVERLGLKGAVRFLGYIDDMPGFLKACTIVCIPSVAEPFGRTVIESFAVGIPVVASSVGGIKETVTHDENGLLVSYGDVEGLEASIQRLLTDKTLAMRISKKAREDAELKYAKSVYVARLHAIIREVGDVTGQTIEKVEH